MAAPVALQPPKGASYDSALLQEGILKPPALRVVDDYAFLEAVWKQSLYTRRGYLIYRARLRTDLLDNRSLDMLLEISKGLIY